MSRLRSLCDASYVRPTNRAARSIRARGSVNHRKKNLLLKTHMGFLGVSPKQSGKRGRVQGRERKPQSDGVSSPSLFYN